MLITAIGLYSCCKQFKQTLTLKTTEIMKKRKLLLIGLLIWNINSVLGQSCGTPHPI
jgi:hypothetical protein